MNNLTNRSLTILAAATAIYLVPTLSRAEETAKPASAAHSHGHGHEGKREDLGTTAAGELKLTATQIGAVESGKEAIFEIALPNDAKQPKAVRVWIGTESGDGSAKAKAQNDGEDWEVHVEAPKELGAVPLLWVEVQPEAGSRTKASFAIKK